MKAQAEVDKELALIERLDLERLRNIELGMPAITLAEQLRKDRQRTLIEEKLLKGEEEEKTDAKEKVIHLYIFIILFS